MTSKADALTVLATQAMSFARCYVALAEALMREGVPETTARQEARAAAATAVLFDSTQAAGSCPVCGAEADP